MDNLWHPPIEVRAALTRGNNKVRAARKRQDLQRKAERAAKRKQSATVDELFNQLWQ